MGLFSAKTKTYVSSVSYNLAGDDIQNYLQSIIVNSVLNGTPIAATMNQSYLTGQGIKLKQMYNYGRDHYSLGLPTSTATTGTVEVSEVQPVIAAIAGKSVLISETYIGTPDYSFWAYQYLADNYGYDESTATFASPPSGVEATATFDTDITEDGEIRITFTNSDDSSKQISFLAAIDNLANYLYVPYRTVDSPVVTTDTQTRLKTSDDEEGITTSTSSQTVTGTTTTTQVQTTTTFNADGLTVTVETVTTVGVTSRMYYFIYVIGSGTYPSLDALASTADLASPYYPWVVLRNNNKDLTTAAYQDTDQFKTSKKLLNKAGLKIMDLANAINDNDNVGDIDFAFVHFGIALNTKVAESKEYLFRYFTYLEGSQKYTKADWTDWYAQYQKYMVNKQSYATSGANAGSVNYYSVAQPGTNGINIRYSTDTWYNVTLSWQYINISTANEVIGSVGDITITCQHDPVVYTIYSDVNDTIEQYSVSATPLFIKKQINATQVQTIEILGLQHDNYVYSGKSVTTTADSAVNDEDETGFIVPLNKAVFDEMGIVDITQACYDCMHITFNCYKKVKQKWYQTTIFKVVIVVIAIVVTVLSWGTLSAPAAAVASAAAAAGATATVALIAGILTEIAISVAVSMAIKIAAQYISPDLFAIISIALVAYGAYAVGSNYAATGEVSASTSMASSSTYMAATSATVQGYTASMKYQTQKLVRQMADETTAYQNELDVITDLNKDLYTLTNEIDTTELQGSYWGVFESSSDFLTRTLGATSTTGLATSQVESFTANSLNITGGLL